MTGNGNHPTPPNRSSFAPIESDRSVRGGEDHAAAGEMAAHQPGEHRLRRRVERGGRLVEQPERPLDRDQPRDRQPPPLPGGEIGGGQVGDAAEPDGVERRGGRRCRRRDSGPRNRGFRPPSATASARPGGRDSGPARRCVASASPPSSSSRPVGDPDQAGDQPQQRGLAGAVRPAHQQGLAGAQGEAQARRTPRRPPLTQASSEARSRVGRRIGRIRASCRRRPGVARQPAGRPKSGRPAMPKIRAFPTASC